MRPSLFRLLGTAATLAALAGTAHAEDFDLQALVEQARAEPPITVYAVTGKIVETAEAFGRFYGLEATGKKVNEAEQAELLLREAQAGRVTGDLAIAGDLAVTMGQLMPAGIVETWLPPDLGAQVPPGLRDPLIVISDPHVWSYDTEVHEHCPVTNIWQLTRPEWRARVAMMDPLAKPAYADWFNQMASHHDAAMAAAYAEEFGKPLDVSQESATAQWVRAYAANAPMIGDSTAVAEAVGAVGQTAPFFGIMSTAKYRDNAKGATALGICAGMKPFAGWLYPGVAAIATGTKSPAAARLFVRYLLSPEGIAPQTEDGKISANAALPPDPRDPSGVGALQAELMVYDPASAADDLDQRQAWQDLWRTSLAR